ncbi:hypothetical protein ACXR0O_21325 [Verrucomicrobiota bacterium sgz303538]
MKASLWYHVGWSVVAVAAFTFGYLAGASSDRKTAPSSSAILPLASQTGTSGNSPDITQTERKQSTGDNSTKWEPVRKSVIERATQALLIGSDLRRQRAFFALLDDMQPSDAPAIHALLTKSQQQSGTYADLWAQFWMRWGEIDGPGAMEFILKTQKYPSMDGDIGRIMWGWGAAHPEEAAQWLEVHQGLDQINKALIGLTHGYATENLAGATKMAMRATPSGDPLLGKLMEALSEQAVRQGRVAGLTAWFDTLPASSEPGNARAAALGHVYSRLWSADPDKAMDWVGQQSSKPWRSDAVIGELAGRVAEKDPTKALTWLQSITPSNNDNSYPGLAKIVRTWSARNPDAAAQWIKALPDSTFKDQATAAYPATQKSSKEQSR